MNYLITGGCGFLGSNLAREVLIRGDKLWLLDNLARPHGQRNLDWLRQIGEFAFLQSDIRSTGAVRQAVRESRPDVVFHLAGQVAMTTSLSDPRLDFETNVIGGHNLLEAVRESAPEATVVYSSTNKVYGDLGSVQYQETATRYVARGHEDGFDERLPLDFRSPYGCSKGAVDQYMLDFARVYGLNTVVFRHSSIFGARQFCTFDQGWIGWFVRQALETRRDPKREPFTISGDGKQVRDILFSSDLVTLYFQAARHIGRARGNAFNIGGGPANSLSLLELFAWLEERLGITLNYTHLPWRPDDQKVFIADISKARQLLDWEPLVASEDGLRQIMEWIEYNG